MQDKFFKRTGFYGQLIKRAAIAVGLFVMAGCNTTDQTDGSISSKPENASLGQYSGLKAFKAICLDTAPSFASAVSVAKRYGVQDFMELGGGKMGMTADKSLSAQITPNHECAVTTPNYSGNRVALRQEFLNLVSSATGMKVAGSKVPFTAEINGTRLIFMHDTRGGEAFVVLRAR